MSKKNRKPAIELKGKIYCVTTTDIKSDSKKLEGTVVEIIENLKEFQSKVDRKLCEIKEICLGEINER